MVELAPASFLAGDWVAVQEQVGTAAELLRGGLAGANFALMFTVRGVFCGFSTFLNLCLCALSLPHQCWCVLYFPLPGAEAETLNRDVRTGRAVAFLY